MTPENRVSRQRVGDVASLLGRVFHTILLAFLAVAFVVTAPLQAAPFAAIVMDARTGEILYEKNARTRLHPASLTKMMTLYIVFQEIEAGRLSLDTMVTVSKYAAAQPPSRLGLKPGQKIAVRHLIRAAAIKSANDAAAALGDAVSGDHVTFAKRMTRTARQLGMNDTTFRNAHGLTQEGHLSTAYDMNVLGRHIFYDFPQYYSLFSRRTADAGIATVTNTNSRFLDGYEGADGIKTGFTSAAGFNLTASARRGNKHIIATVFGGTSTVNRNARMIELMDIGFGAAKNRVKERPPVAPAPLPPDALIASASNEIDEIDAAGGAGKTIRVSGEVRRSLRPKARPEKPSVPDEVTIAIAAGVADALAEATAEPAPKGTLEFQAEAIAAGAPPVETPAPEAVAEAVAVAVAAAEPASEPAPEALLAEAAPAPEPGTLEAQAAALAMDPAAADAPLAALPEEAVDPALLAVRPMPRPETVPETALAAAPEAAQPEAVALVEAQPAEPAVEVAPEAAPVVMAAAAPPASEPTEEIVLAAAQPEIVVTDPGLPVEDPLLAELTAVETVAAAAQLPPGDVPVTAPSGTRKAPIFDTVAVAEEPAPEPVEEVVVVMSTSGGRHYGVHVGEYASRYDAERALLKTALAESATLNDGLRKTTQAGGKWRASFMGLTEDQAQLACRRLRARAVTCETVGG